MISLHFAEKPLMGYLMQGCDMLRYLFYFYLFLYRKVCLYRKWLLNLGYIFTRVKRVTQSPLHAKLLSLYV